LNRIQQTEPEIREDLQGRIEVFDQSIRSFEKRLRAVERRLSLETLSSQQAGVVFSSNFSDTHIEENGGAIAAGSQFIPQRPSIAPQSSIPENSFLSGSIPLLSEVSIPNFALSAVIPSGEVPNASMLSMDNSSEVSINRYKVININHLFSSLSESLRAFQAELSELSNFAHNNLKSEIERLDIEMKGLKDKEERTNEYLKGIELRIETLENQNRLTFGSIRIPLEISGIMGSSVLFLTGFLVWSGQWDVIKSPYFSIGLAMLMAVAVLIKFYMVNRKKKLLANME
jgi:predicted outer membrane repeat protein